jgi:hypothetical protein
MNGECSAMGGKYGQFTKYQVMQAKEVAAAMGNISDSGVDVLTKSAIRKLRRSPVLFLHWLESGRERLTQNVGTEEEQ